ncbi:MAG: basic secretory protein-like protein, partial [Isosphaeraceae bacterium]
MLLAIRSVAVGAMVLVMVPAMTWGQEPVAATIETTMATHGDEIRQLAYDGRMATFFAAEKPATADDHFTMVFEKPVIVKSIVATTGRPDGSGTVGEGVLEASADGKSFQKLARFRDGIARAQAQKEPVRAIRIRPGATTVPIAIREVALVTDRPVPVFRYPVEFVVDTTDAPELKPWAENAARTCERAYPMINDELASDGFNPPRVIRMTISKSYRGVAATGGDRIVGSVDYFKNHRKDVGAMVHETVHVVQSYRRGDRPGWLVEGVSDYIRFFKYE